MWGNKIQKDKNKTKTIRWYPPPVLPHPNINQPPPTYPIPQSLYNDTMNMTFMVEMIQSSKCESLTNDEIINLHLGSTAGPRVSIPWHQPHLLIPSSQTINQEKQRIQKWDPPSSKSCCTALGIVHRTQD